MAYNSANEESFVTAWTPDLFGPIFKKDSMTLKQVRPLRCVFSHPHDPLFPNFNFNFIYSMH